MKTLKILLGIIFLATIATLGYLLFQPKTLGTSTRTKTVYLDRANTFSNANTFNGTTTFSGYVSGVGFGGTGIDGDLNITTGTTTIDAAGSNFVVKNYDNLSIASGSVLTLTNTATSGTILIIKVKKTATINGKIDLKGKGAYGSTSFTNYLNDSTNSVAGTAYANPNLYNLENLYYNKRFLVFTGSGGAGGNNNCNPGLSPSLPGTGGGGLYLEANNITFGGIIDISGTDAIVGNCNPQSQWWSAGAGGGSVGSALIVYNNLTSNTGTLIQGGGRGANMAYNYLYGTLLPGNGGGSYGASTVNSYNSCTVSDGAGGCGGGSSNSNTSAGFSGATTTKAILFIKNSLY